MKKQIICMCIIFSMIFSGCMVSDVRTSENNTQIESEEDTSNMQTKNENDDDDEEDAVSFGYDETDESAAMDTYVYTGDALSVPYHLQAQKATGHDVGFLIFIDGVCQKYSVKEDTGEVTEEEYMHRFTLSDTNEKKFTFLIQPNIGKKGDKKGIYVCGIIYPGFQPESKTEPSYQYYGNLFQTVPQQVRFEADSKNNEKQQAVYSSDGKEIPEEIKNTYEALFGISIEESGGRQSNVELFKDGSEEAYIEEKSEIAVLHFQMYGGKAGTYRTTLFINHEPVLVDGKNYIETEYKDKTMSTYDINLDVSKIPQNSTIYAITVPADQNYLEYEDVKKTPSKLLWLERK